MHVPLQDTTAEERFGCNTSEMKAPSRLGINPLRRVANPIILHHSSSIHLAFGFFFPQQAICGFPTGCLQSQNVLTTKHSCCRLGATDKAVSAVSDPVRACSDSCQPTTYTPMASMTDVSLQKWRPVYINFRLKDTVDQQSLVNNYSAV